MRTAKSLRVGNSLNSCTVNISKILTATKLLKEEYHIRSQRLSFQVTNLK
ncbi:hypothetical protein PAE9249_04863 [Paenibacillus sp. CECT 9249]|nr:hypothetical protein PAE9249_04863 [Paenibacillus sp. CECT 9249]